MVYTVYNKKFIYLQTYIPTLSLYNISIDVTVQALRSLVNEISVLKLQFQSKSRVLSSFLCRETVMAQVIFVSFTQMV